MSLLPTAHGDMVSDDVRYPPSSLAFAAATRLSGSLNPSSLADFLGHGQNDYFGPVGLAPSKKNVKVPEKKPRLIQVYHLCANQMECT